MGKRQATSELAALVEAQMDICDEMIALSRREQEVLARFRPAHLPELLAAQDDCADRLAKAQAAMDDALCLVAAEYGLSCVEGGQPLTIDDVLPHLPPEIRTRLGALRDALDERAYTLAVLNAQNALLVRTGLLQIERTAAVLASVEGEPRAYEAGGVTRIPPEGGARFLSRHA